MKVGVIGGGAAGLAVVYELIKQGHQATVYERAPFLGGQASTFEVVKGAQPLERGYHHLFTSDVDMVALIHELGLGHKLAWIPSKVGLFHKDRLWDFVTPKDLLRFNAISLIDRIRLGFVSLKLQRSKDWRQYEGVTASEWLRRHVGTSAYEAVWEPLLRGKFGQQFSDVGMTWFWGKVFLRFASRGKLMAKERLGYPMGSFGEVFDTLGEWIKGSGNAAYTGAAVKRVLVEEGRAVGLEVEMPGLGVSIEPFDAIVATVPSSIFPSLVPPLPGGYMDKLTSVKYLAAVLVVLVLNRPLSRVYWMNIADRSIPFVALIEQTNFIDPARYGGKHILYIANYLGPESPLFHMDKEKLLTEYLPHLRRINPQFDPSWILESFYHREGAAQPVIGVNYSRRIPAHRSPVRSLYLANTTQIYPEDRGTNYSVRLGRKVARLVLMDYGYDAKGELPTPAIRDAITSQTEWES